MAWTFLNARQSFDKYRDRWDQINKSQGNHILLDSVFVGVLLRCFGSDDILLGISDTQRNPSMLLLEKVRSGFWQTFQPSQAPLGLILLPNDQTIQTTLESLMASLPGYCFGLSVTQQDPDCTSLVDLTYSPTVERCDYMETSRIDLVGDFESFWKRTGRYFVDDLRRQTRRLADQGIQMEFVADRDPVKVAEYVRDYAILEQAGWKGREGSAVTAEGPQGLFYTEILQNFCSRDEAVIYRLLFNGRVAASDLCLERGGMTVVLKIAYDENLQGLSPGKFIHREIIRHLFTERKITTLEWYGRVHEWQRRLGSVGRTMFHVNFFRHHWIPVARRSIKSALGAFHQDNSG